MDKNREILLKEIGRKLRMARMRRGMTQVELAKAVGYSDSTTIHKIEKGLQDIPISKIRAFCRVLDVDFDYLKGNVDYIYNDQGIAVMVETHPKSQKEELMAALTTLVKDSTPEQLDAIIGIVKIYLGGDKNGNTDME